MALLMISDGQMLWLLRLGGAWLTWSLGDQLVLLFLHVAEHEQRAWPRTGLHSDDVGYVRGV